jgi:hypothetical protein
MPTVYYEPPAAKIHNLQLTSRSRRSYISTIVALSFACGRKPFREEHPLSRGERIITIPIVILAIGLMIATFRVDLASLLSFEATPTATDWREWRAGCPPGRARRIPTFPQGRCG